MKKENLFDKIIDLKDRFKSFFQHRKKIAALENFSTAEKFPHRNYLSLVKTCINDGFLEEAESAFLDHMLTKYEINYLDWAHRTKWLKGQIYSRQVKKPLAVQSYFDFDKTRTPIHVPVELLQAKANRNGARA